MTASNFPVSEKFTIQAEGGWSDNPLDNGGPTMKGITWGTFRAHFPHATLNDLRNITDEQVSDIYRSGYWNAVKGDDLPGGVDLMVADFGFNAGPGRSVRLLQEAVGVKEDGWIGPKTMAAIQAMRFTNLLTTLVGLQRAYYRSLPTFGTFGLGWMNRTDARVKAALAASFAASDPAQQEGSAT